MSLCHEARPVIIEFEGIHDPQYGSGYSAFVQGDARDPERGSDWLVGWDDAHRHSVMCG